MPLIAYISLGSNLGDSSRIIQEAFQRLQAINASPLLKSSLWRTTPVDCPPGSPAFLNAVVGLTPGTHETPDALLRQLQGLEKEFGRRPKKVLNEPRPLDLDLLSYGDIILQTSQLTLPHPRAHLRRFVLEPWHEIAPEFAVPGLGKTVRQLRQTLTSDESVVRLEIAQ